MHCGASFDGRISSLNNHCIERKKTFLADGRGQRLHCDNTSKHLVAKIIVRSYTYFQRATVSQLEHGGHNNQPSFQSI